MIVGRQGQGATIAADIVAQAAIDDGYRASTGEVHRMKHGLDGVECCVRLRASETAESQTLFGVDMLIAFDHVQGLACMPLLNRSGHALLPGVVGELDIRRFSHNKRLTFRFDQRVEWQEPDNLSGEQTAMAAVCHWLGRASLRLPFGGSAWEHALRRHLSPRRFVTGLEAFHGARSGKSALKLPY